MRIVPDTSVIIDGRITAMVEEMDYDVSVIVPEAVVSELEAMANKGKETGFKGLDELKKLNLMAKDNKIKLEYMGERPTLDQIKLASSGVIDSIIINIAIESKAKLVTSDLIQYKVAEAKGLEVIYLPEREKKIEEEKEKDFLKIEEFFTSDTMSVHLKENVPPMAKRGTVGEMHLVKIREELCTESELQDLAREIIEKAKTSGFIELERKGATIIQLKNMRIAISKPPFSDGIEITAVRPIAKVSFDSYKFSKELKERIIERQRGVLIAGAPGAGKSTFASGVAEFLLNQGYIVKTMESPRDLQVPSEITQYSSLEGDMAKTADILLLVRPDYTIYDEVRKTKDFMVFADMRLAGVGMVGVVHASRAIDALQRLIGRVELGIIPQVVDTVVFIEKGEVSKVYNVDFTVKVPHGMVEADLARPVIAVRDFETNRIEYEIYTYGEQIVVMPVLKETKKPAWKLAEREIKKEFEKYASGEVEVDVLSDNKAKVYVSDYDIPYIIGSGGANINKIEQKLGISIDVHSTDLDKFYTPAIRTTRKYLIFNIPELSGKTVDVFMDKDFLFNAAVSRKGEIRIKKDSEIASKIFRAYDKDIKVKVSEGK
ncbi:MAG: PINc/VapC family ATPase [Methanosarcinales archaeon]